MLEKHVNEIAMIGAFNIGTSHVTTKWEGNEDHFGADDVVLLAPYMNVNV